MKILLHSNSAWMATGYGTQTAEIGNHLAHLGVNVDFSCNAGLHQGHLKLQLPGSDIAPSNIYPAGIDDSGSSVIWGHYQDSRPDFVVSLYDAIGMESRAPGGASGPGWGRFNFPWVPFAMVDDGPPLAAYHRDSLMGARAILCLTRWAEDQLRGWAHGAGIPLLFAPHSIEPEVWKPMDKVKAKEFIGISPHRFVVAFVGDWEGWPGRKGLIETVDAFSRLGREIGYDDLTLLVHSRPATDPPHAMTLVSLRDTFGIPATSFITETTHYAIVGRSTEHMVQLYNAADVLCLPSRSEAFGLTALHAEFCGVPTIVPDAHALAETTYGAYRFRPIGDMMSWKLSRWAQVGAAPVFEKLRIAYDDGDKGRRERGAQSRERSVANYSTDAVRPCWEAVTGHLAEMMPKKTLVVLTGSADSQPGVAVVIPTVPETEVSEFADVDGEAPAAWRAQGAYVEVVVDGNRQGYPISVNAGVRKLVPSMKWVIVWNDDCIPDDNVLKLLTEGAAQHGLTLAAPVIIRAEGEERTVEMGWELYHGGVRPMSEPWVEGAKYQPLGGNLYAPMFLVRRDAWEWAGGFDERYSPGYYEDADLVRRLAASGYKCGVIPEARAVHFSGSTFRRLYTEAERAAITRRNRQFYSWKFSTP